MRIDRLLLKNFRYFKELELELHPRCTVLAGINGSGKTTILDSLAVATGSLFLGFSDIRPRSILNTEIRRERFSRKGHIDLEPQFPVCVKAKGEISGKPHQWMRELRKKGGNTTYGEAKEIKTTAENFQRSIQKGEEVTLPVIAYYGTGRLWAQKRASQHKIELTSRTNGYLDCLDPESNHKLFESWMKQREKVRLQQIVKLSALTARAEPDKHDMWKLVNAVQEAEEAVQDDQLQAVSLTAAKCVENGRRFIFDFGSDELRLVFHDDTEQSFELLSDGYRNLVALAADIAWRAVRLNPHLGAAAPAETSGVVLIDEIELHLHPAWQRTVMKQLLAAFPKIQFIVTTHSPQVLASVQAENVRFLAADGVHLVNAAEGLDTNTILRDLMGVSERPEEFAQKLERVADLIETAHFDQARILLDELAAIFRPDDPALTGLEWELADALSMSKEL